MPKIQKLAPHVINLIAAGEVVERPASIVKELLENSIDARATHVKVYIENYGIDLIEVIDNGQGISKEDIPLVFEQHATSKISKSKDLLEINSFGFRGEAMASIRSVSEKIILQSKIENDSPHSVIVTPTSINEYTSDGYQNGTRIQVFNIFSTVPARKKFLKTPATELKHITQTFLQIAMANPKIHFELHHNNRVLYNLVPGSDLERIADILDTPFVKNSYKINSISSKLEIKGLLGNSTLGKKYKPTQYLFINQRFVTNKTISSAVQKAYSGFLHKDLKPQYILFLKLDPKEVDVNVHPRKLEVRFDDPAQIFKLVYVNVKKTLELESKKEIINDFNITNISNKETNRVKQASVHDNALITFTNKNTFSSKQVSSSKNIDKKDRSLNIQKALTFTQKLLEDKQISNNLTDSFVEVSFDRKPKQIFNTYILIEKNQNLIIIDQHAAHEKIMFEKLLIQNNKKKPKPLLIPQIIELSETEIESLNAQKNPLMHIGFRFEKFGQKSLQITEIPEQIEHINLENFFKEILNEEDDLLKNFQTYEFDQKITLTKEQFVLLAKTACHGSIRAGQKLTIDEMNNLIANLFKLKYPKNCPHGRPTYYKLEKTEIDKFFKRIV
jgi:DNA mismatch repair protein MutL